MTGKDDIWHNPIFAKLAASLMAQAPAFAGGVLSLAFVGKLSVWGRMLAVGVGVITSVYLAPALSDLPSLLFGLDLTDPIRRGIQFLVALIAMGVLPELLTALKRYSGDPLGIIERFLPTREAAKDNTGGGQ